MRSNRCRVDYGKELGLSMFTQTLPLNPKRLPFCFVIPTIMATLTESTRILTNVTILKFDWKTCTNLKCKNTKSLHPFPPPFVNLEPLFFFFFFPGFLGLGGCHAWKGFDMLAKYSLGFGKLCSNPWYIDILLYITVISETLFFLTNITIYNKNVR